MSKIINEISGGSNSTSAVPKNDQETNLMTNGIDEHSAGESDEVVFGRGTSEQTTGNITNTSVQSPTSQIASTSSLTTILDGIFGGESSGENLIDFKGAQEKLSQALDINENSGAYLKTLVKDNQPLKFEIPQAVAQPDQGDKKVTSFTASDNRGVLLKETKRTVEGYGEIRDLEPEVKGEGPVILNLKMSDRKNSLLVEYSKDGKPISIRPAENVICDEKNNVAYIQPDPNGPKIALPFSAERFSAFKQEIAKNRADLEKELGATLEAGREAESAPVRQEAVSAAQPVAQRDAVARSGQSVGVTTGTAEAKPDATSQRPTRRKRVALSESSSAEPGMTTKPSPAKVLVEAMRGASSVDAEPQVGFPPIPARSTSKSAKRGGSGGKSSFNQSRQ